MELIFIILKRKPRRVIEVGCGPGSLSFVLSLFNLEITALDRDRTVIKLAKRILKNKVHLILGEATNLPFRENSFDMVFHQGFLEHCNTKTIIKLIAEQKRIGKNIICSVPSNNYPKKDFGNEKLLPVYEWSRLLPEFYARYYYLDLSSLKNWLLGKCKPKPLHIILILPSKAKSKTA